MRGLRWCLNTIKPTGTAPRVRPDSPCAAGKSFLEQPVDDAAALQAGYSWDDMPQHILEVIFIQVWETTHPSVRHKVGLRLCRVCCRWRDMVQHMFFISPWAAAPAIAHPLQLTTLCPAGLGPPGLLRGYVVRQPAALGLPGRRLLLTFHAGPHPGSGKFLLAARPGGSGSGVAWSITCDRRGEGMALAVLRSNLLATSYTLGAGPGPLRGAAVAEAGPAAAGSGSAISSSSSGQSTSLAVQYRLGMRGMTLPRRVHVLLDMTAGRSPVAMSSSCSSSALARTQHPTPRGAAAAVGGKLAGAPNAQSPPVWGSRPGPLLLENRRPHWNEGLRCWCLNFKGRVKLASIKNFQLQLVGTQQATGMAMEGGADQQQPPAAQHPDEVEDEVLQEEEQEQDLQEQDQQPAEAVAGVQLLGAPATGAHAAPAAGQEPGGIRRGGLVLQFGKVEEHQYVLDYAPHLMTAVEAFAIALTSFDSKMLM